MSENNTDPSKAISIFDLLVNAHKEAVLEIQTYLNANDISFTSAEGKATLSTWKSLSKITTVADPVLSAALAPEGEKINAGAKSGVEGVISWGAGVTAGTGTTAGLIYLGAGTTIATPSRSIAL